MRVLLRHWPALLGLSAIVLGVVVELFDVSTGLDEAAVVVIVGALAVLAATLPAWWVGLDDDDRGDADAGRR